MTTLAVAVVVPTYNRAAHLDRLLAALDRCDVPDGGYEVVVVDDGSTDATADTATRYARVRYLRQENAGPAAARNRGWRSTTAPIVVFIDDDCIPERRWLVELVAPFDASSVAAVGGRIDPAVPGLLSDFVTRERLVDHGVEHGGSPSYLVTASAAFRRDALVRAGGFDEGFGEAAGEDVDLSWRIAPAGDALRLCDAAVVRHVHRVSLRSVVATYARHGRSAARLRERHPERVSAHVWRLLHPRVMLGRYTAHRCAGFSRVRALFFVGLRSAGLLVFELNRRRVATGTRSGSGRSP